MYDMGFTDLQVISYFPVDLFLKHMVKEEQSADIVVLLLSSLFKVDMLYLILLILFFYGLRVVCYKPFRELFCNWGATVPLLLCTY
jgi:hypothetical protein